MCGIAGYIGSRRLDEMPLQRTLERMASRGPDHRDLVHIEQDGRHVHLLNSRLSIIDLDDRANLPMTRNQCTLVFNGEIYNYREMRKALEARGFPFTTDSDSEVLLTAYIADGPQCVERFEGMWAFAIYDARARVLLRSRDRFGEKPLYTLRTPDGLYFGSEVKYLFALSGESPTVNRRHLARFLVNGYKALHKTGAQFFEDIEETPSGTNITIDHAGHEKSRRYWTPHVGIREIDLDTAISEVGQRLRRSVELRLRSDVPVAFCLSGGVDSGLLTSLAAKSLGREVTTFSIIDRDERYDESANIRKTVDDLDCEHVALEIPRTGSLDRLATLIEYHDAPVYTLSYYVHSFLSEAMADRGYKVVLSGIGADELFTGYYDHFNLHLYEMRHHPEFAVRLAEWKQHVRGLVRNPHLQRGDLYFDKPDFRGHVYLNNDFFATALREDFHEAFVEHSYSDSLLRNRMLNELFHETVPPSLHEDDLNSMRCSLENRSPYLDSELFELAYSVPVSHLIRDGYAKYLLREAGAGVLNDTVRLDRLKVGFNAAFASVVDVDDLATRDRLLEPGPVFDLVYRDKISELLGLRPLPNSYSKFLFSFVSVKLFLERFG